MARLAEEAKRQNLDKLVDGVKADYHNLPFPDNYADAAYQIEAFCHATDLKKVYSEVRFCLDLVLLQSSYMVFAGVPRVEARSSVCRFRVGVDSQV